MNAVLNVKTAEKNLQFGISKCKSMFVGKHRNEALNTDLFVDKWKVEFNDDKDTGEENLNETFEGLYSYKKNYVAKISWFYYFCRGK